MTTPHKASYFMMNVCSHISLIHFIFAVMHFRNCSLVEKCELDTIQCKLRLKPEIRYTFCKIHFACILAVHGVVQILNMNAMETIWLTLWGFSSKNSRLDQRCCQDQESENEKKNWLVYCMSAHSLINQVKLNLQIRNTTDHKINSATLLTSDTKVTLW